MFDYLSKPVTQREQIMRTLGVLDRYAPLDDTEALRRVKDEGLIADLRAELDG